MKNDSRWTSRTNSKSEAPPKKIEDIIYPFLKNELGIDLPSRGQPSAEDMGIAQAAFAEAARLLLLASPYGSQAAEYMLSNTDFLTAVVRKLGNDEESLKNAISTRSKLISEIKNGLSIDRSIV